MLNNLKVRHGSYYAISEIVSEKNAIIIHHPKQKLQSKNWLKLGLRASYGLSTCVEKILYVSNLVLCTLLERYLNSDVRYPNSAAVSPRKSWVQCALQTKFCPLIPQHDMENNTKGIKKTTTKNKHAAEKRNHAQNCKWT